MMESRGSLPFALDVDGSVRQLAGSAEGGVLSGVPPLMDTLNLFLVQAIIVLAMCRALGLLGSYFKQPKVIFEIVGGILLGPSAIGRNENYMKTIFPTASLGYIGLVANIGLVLYLFIVGLELDPTLLMTHARRAGTVAIVGMIVPFCLGVAISSTMFEALQGSDPKYSNVKPEAFFVFIGTALSITAFPVLARILKESGLIYTVPGAMVMGAAALNDAVAWCLLILAISIGKAGTMATAGYVFLSVVAFAVGLLVVVRPLFFRLVYLVESWHSALWGNYLFAFTLMMVFLCAWITALLGVHAIFGSFLFGLICVPRDCHLFLECNESIEELVVTFMLPLYFALSGLKTDVTTINRGEDGAQVILVCFIATIGKFIGAGVPAYFSGMSFRESSVVAVLMNTRGLIELIVLNLGMDAGILSVRTFSVMVIMCLFTTFITCPIIELIYPPSIRSLEASAAASRKTVTDKTLQVGSTSSGSISVRVPGSPATDGDDAAFLEDVENGPSHAAHELVFNLEQMLMHPRLGIFIDRIEHLEGIMKIVMLFAPLSRASSLDVIGMHFHEPSFTTMDVFVGLNAENKLLEVVEEPTTVNHNVLERHRDKSHRGAAGNSETLPLSMFVKVIGGRVEAYRIRGDPVHFPGELNAKTLQNEVNVVLFPWRESKFVEQTFWGTIKLVSSPVALLIQNHVQVLNIPEGQADAHDVRDARAPSEDHQSNLSRKMSDPTGRGRSGSETVRAESDASADQSVGSGDHTLPRLLPSRATSAVENVVVNKVLAIVTGAPCDMLMLPFVIGCASNHNLSVTVMITNDTSTFSPSLEAALDSFKRRVRAMRLTNVVFEKIKMSTNEPDALMVKLATGATYDLITLGFAIPKTTRIGGGCPPPTPDAAGSATPPRKDSVDCEAVASSTSPKLGARRPSMAAAFARAAVEMVSPTPDILEHRALIGMPEAIIDVGLQHPELGTLGSLLHAAKLAPFMLVFHEPVVGSIVAATLFEDSNVSSAPSTTAAAVGGLGSITEEDTSKSSSNDSAALVGGTD